MAEIAKVEGDEIVIRVPVSALKSQPADPGGFWVADPARFAPHVAREISGQDMGERLWIEPLIEAAIERAAEGDAPGLLWDDGRAHTKEHD